MKRGMVIAALALLAGQARGQSFNVDINNTAGLGAGVPAASFGGAAGQPGMWNAVSSASAVTSALKDLAGVATAVTITRPNVGTWTGTDDVNVSGDTAKLMEDYLTNPGGSLVFTFNNIQNGDYIIYTYVAVPNSTNKCYALISNSEGVVSQLTGANMTSNTLTPGQTHAVHGVHVATNTLTIDIGSGFAGNAAIAGIQVKYLGPSAQETLRMHVNDNAAGSNDGTSWANAWTDVQTALTAARLMGGRFADVWVSQGFYYPTSGTDRTISFDIVSGMKLRGGFNGTETSLAQRGNPTYVATYLLGSIGGASTSDNSYTVVNMENCNSNTELDGFYIGRGQDDSGSPNSGRGAGLHMYYCIGSWIRNCRFIHNWSSNDGAGVYSDDSTTNFINCYFLDNVSDNGAGGAFAAVGPIETTTRFHNCTFFDNQSMAGGAIHLNFVYAEASNCLFTGNTSATNGGAVYAAGDTQYFKFWNCTLAGNNANTQAGGIYASTGLDVWLYNSILWGNTDAVSADLTKKQIVTVTAHGSALYDFWNTIQGMDPDPQFVDADGPDNIYGTVDDNCHLQDDSPCIDAGNNNYYALDNGDMDGDTIWNEASPFDLDGKPRRVDHPLVADTGFGGSPLLDRGCYEAQFTFCPADYNLDGFVDGIDYDLFMADFEGGVPKSDFNNDGFVDGIDYDQFMIAFESGC